MNLGRIDVADALRRVEANKAKRKAPKSDLQMTVFGSDVIPEPVKGPSSYSISGIEKRNSLAAAVLSQVGRGPMTLKPPPRQARSSQDLVNPPFSGPEFAPVHTQLRQTPGTLEHAMAQVDQQFPGLDPQSRQGIKAHLQSVMQTELGARARLERKSLLDISPELASREIKQFRPTQGLLPESMHDTAAAAALDYVNRLAVGQVTGPAQIANALAGLVEGADPIKTGESMLPVNPLDESLSEYDRTTGALDIAAILTGGGFALRGKLRGRAMMRQSGAAARLAEAMRASSPDIMPPPEAAPTPAQMHPGARQVVETGAPPTLTPTKTAKKQTAPKTAKKSTKKPVEPEAEPMDTHRPGDRVAIFSEKYGDVGVGEVMEVTSTGLKVRFGKEVADVQNSPKLHNLDNARYDARPRPEAVKGAYERAGTDKNAFRPELEEPKTSPREGTSPVSEAPPETPPVKTAKKSAPEGGLAGIMQGLAKEHADAGSPPEVVRMFEEGQKDIKPLPEAPPKSETPRVDPKVGPFKGDKRTLTYPDGTVYIEERSVSQGRRVSLESDPSQTSGWMKHSYKAQGWARDHQAAVGSRPIVSGPPAPKKSTKKSATIPNMADNTNLFDNDAAWRTRLTQKTKPSKTLIEFDADVDTLKKLQDGGFEVRTYADGRAGAFDSPDQRAVLDKAGVKYDVRAAKGSTAGGAPVVSTAPESGAIPEPSTTPPKTAKKAETPKVGKEPWEMTREEFDALPQSEKDAQRNIAPDHWKANWSYEAYGRTVMLAAARGEIVPEVAIRDALSRNPNLSLLVQKAGGDLGPTKNVHPQTWENYQRASGNVPGAKPTPKPEPSPPGTVDVTPDAPVVEGPAARPQTSDPVVYSPKQDTSWKVKVVEAHGDGSYTVTFPREANIHGQVRVWENPTNPQAPRISGISDRLARKGLPPKRSVKKSEQSGAVDPKALAKVTAALLLGAPAVGYGIHQAQQGNPGILEVEAALLASAVLGKPIRAAIRYGKVQRAKAPTTVSFLHLFTRMLNELGEGVVRDVGQMSLDAANLAIWRSGKFQLGLSQAMRKHTGSKAWYKDPKIQEATANLREVMESQGTDKQIEPTPLQQKIIDAWTEVHSKIPQYAWELGIGIEQKLDKTSVFHLEVGGKVRLHPGGIEYKVIQVRDPKTGRFDVKLMRASGEPVRARWAEELATDRAAALELFKTPEAKADYIEAVKLENNRRAKDIRDAWEQNKAERLEEGLGPLPESILEEQLKRATKDPEQTYKNELRRKSLLTDAGQTDVTNLDWGTKFYRPIREVGSKYFPRVLKDEVVDMLRRDESFRKQMAAENVFLNPEYYGLEVGENVFDVVQQHYKDMREFGEAMATDALPDNLKGLVRSGDVASAFREALDDVKAIGDSMQGDKDPMSFAAQLERERRLQFATGHYETNFEKVTTSYLDRVSKRMAVAEAFGSGDPAVVGRFMEFVEHVDAPMANLYREAMARMVGVGESSVHPSLIKAAHYEGAYSVLAHLVGSPTILLRQLTDVFFPFMREGGVTTAKGIIERVRQARATHRGEAPDLDYRHAAAAQKYFTRELDASIKQLGLERGIATTAADSAMHWIGVAEMDGQVKALTHAIGQVGAETSLFDLAFSDAPKRSIKKLVGKDAAGIERKAAKYSFDASDADAVQRRAGELIDEAKTSAGRELTPKEIDIARREAVRRHILETDLRASRVHGAITRDLSYSGAARDIPIMWSHPVMRIANRFKGPALMATRFLVRDVIEEALHGNVVPMTRMLAVGGVVGVPFAKVIQGLMNQDKQTIAEAWEEKGFFHALGTVARNIYDIGLLGWLGEISPYNPGATDKEGQFQTWRVIRPPAAGSLENLWELGARIFQGGRSAFAGTMEVDYPGEANKAAISDWAQREFAWYKQFVKLTGVEPAFSRLDKLERKERKGQMEPFSDEAYEAAGIKARFPESIPEDTGEPKTPRPITETLHEQGLTRTGNPPRTRKKSLGTRRRSIRRASPSQL